MIVQSLARLKAWWGSREPLRAKSRPVRTVRISVEVLEDRLTPSAGAREQYMLELINRMRENPAAELPLLLNSNDPNVNSALSYFNVNRSILQTQWNTLAPAAPLAWNDALALAARNHNQAMLGAGQQTHQAPGEAGLGTRITNAGYTVWSNVGENVFAWADSVFQAHAAFAIDWGSTSTGIQSPPGHRQNIMSSSFRDVGIGILNAPTGSSLGPLLITQDFGNRFSYGNPYLLGVVFNDTNANGFYDMGEGLAGATITVSGGALPAMTTTTDFGGYQLQLPPGNYTVTASGGGLFAPIVRDITVGSSNVRTNFINGTMPQENAPIPFSDSFTRDNTSFLGATYRSVQGSFRIENQAVVGNGLPVNLALLNGVALSDLRVQADINVLPVNGQTAGLVARATSNGSYYLGSVARTTTRFEVRIHKFTGGKFTLLASAPLNAGTGTLRFEVVGSSLKLYFGPDANTLALATYAFDSSVAAPGTAGLRLSQTAVVDNLSVDAVSVPTSQTLPFTDTFDAGSSAQQMSNDWRERRGNFTVTGGVAVASNPAYSLATLNGVSLTDVAVQAEVELSGKPIGSLMARYQSNGNYYFAQVARNAAGTGYVGYIYRFVSGVTTLLSSKSFSATAGPGILRLEVVGSSLKLFYGPDADHLSLVTYAYCRTITGAGQVGIRGYKDARFGAFQVEAIDVATPTALPFTDTFTQANGSQLARTWTERQGNFTVTDGTLAGSTTAAVNLATLNGLALADMAVQADIALKSGQLIGLVTRYQTNGSFYLAQLVANSTGTSFTARLYKYVGGVFIQLKATPPIVLPNAGTLRFEAIGNSLRLSFGPDADHLSLLASVFDNTILTAGLAGIRSRGGVFDNFRVESLPV